MINVIWNTIRTKAGISRDKTLHSARHAVDVRIVKKNGNPAAVQRQLGHKNGLYSLQYMRPSEKDMKDALNER